MGKKFLTVGPTGQETEDFIDTSTGASDADKGVKTNSEGYVDPTLFPPGIGEDVSTFTAGEGIAASDLIYITGAGTIMKADANAAAKAAVGFVNSGIANAASGQAFIGGGIITGLTGLTPGATYYLSTSTPGGITTTAPYTGAGKIQQQVGYAKSATELIFNPQVAVKLTA